MKIVHTCKVWYPRVTGVTVHVDNLAQKMSREGHSVTVITYDLSNEAWDLDRVREKELRNGYAVLRVFPGSRKAFIDAVLKENPDVIHAHGIWEHVFPSFLAAQKRNANFFITAHGTWQFLNSTPGFETKARQWKYKLYYHTLWRLMVMKSSGMIALNAIEEKAHKLLRATKVFRIPNGVDCREFSTGTWGRSEWPWDFKAPYILFAGSVQEQKGIFTLLDAVSSLKKQGENIQVIIAGDGPDQPRAVRFARENSLKAIFLGRVDRSCMPALMAEADLFVLPSKKEPFATVYLEAMSAGTPCIGTDSGGTPEIIDNNRNGFLIPIDDADKLAELLRKYLNQEIDLLAMGTNARKKVASSFDWSILIRKIITAYKTGL